MINRKKKPVFGIYLLYFSWVLLYPAISNALFAVSVIGVIRLTTSI